MFTGFSCGNLFVTIFQCIQSCFFFIKGCPILSFACGTYCICILCGCLETTVRFCFQFRNPGITFLDGLLQLCNGCTLLTCQGGGCIQGNDVGIVFFIQLVECLGLVHRGVAYCGQ